MGRREENKQRKRERLLAEGLRLFQDAGYDRASIEQIAAASGVARGTFYLYFPDKASLFAALMERWYDPVIAILDQVERELQEATTKERTLEIYQQMGMQLMVAALGTPQHILVAFREMRSSGEAGEGLRARELALLEKVTGLTEVAAERGLIRADNPRLVALVIFGSVERLYYEALVGGDIGDIGAAVQGVVRMFAQALELPV